MKPIAYWIERLKLREHPEGGWYAETYRSQAVHAGSGEDFPTGRSYATGIYFLIAPGMFSAFHRIRSDETWHFYAGGPLEIYVLCPEGRLEIKKLGVDLDRGEAPQHVVSARSWFASAVAPGASYSLVGCTVAPGFDFRDFELAERETLSAAYPDHAGLIGRLTRA